MKKYLIICTLLTTALFSCVEDKEFNDVVPESLKITTLGIDTLGVSEDTTFSANYRDNSGEITSTPLVWSSSNPSILNVSSLGLATGVAKGSAYIKVVSSNNTALSDSLEVHVGDNTVVNSTVLSGTLSGAYSLTGSFTVMEDGNDLKVVLSSNYSIASNTPDPVLYITNNNATTTGATMLGNVLSSGSKTFTIPNKKVTDFQYLLVWCDNFNVKIGDGEIQ